MCIDIQSNINHIQKIGLLNSILKDKTTGKNLLWCTDAHAEKGPEFFREKEIKSSLIIGENSDVISIRASKAASIQSARTKQHAEVFTPMWVVKKMNDFADEKWFDRQGVFDTKEPVVFPKRKTWKHYLDSRRLEITCGEAPYLVSRYDAADGNPVAVQERVGILDRKLRIVNENTSNEAEWNKWVLRAFQSTYGYEFQGDNLLIARINLLMTYRDYMEDRWGHEPTLKEYKTILNVISWNIWQMDGLTGRIPYCCAEEDYHQITLDEFMLRQTGMSDEEIRREERMRTQMPCRIYDWRAKCTLEFNELKKKEGKNI